jgi:hypothetical protein
MQLTQQQKDLLVGTLLGDGNLQTETKGRTWRYRVLQKKEHKLYLDHKYDLIKNFCTTGPIYSEVFDERTKETYKRWFFNTNVHDCFRFYGNMFYKYDPINNKVVKDVPLNIQKFLTPASIAYWYMDDGSLKWEGHSNAMRICTESFSQDGVHRLQKAIKNLYNISTSLTKKTKVVDNNRVIVGYRIAINEAASADFRRLVEPHLVGCMKYTVSDGNKGNL